MKPILFEDMAIGISKIRLECKQILSRNNNNCDYLEYPISADKEVAR